MKVEVWSDIACPFCYIGHRRLEWALQQVGFAEEVEVAYRSFQLDARAPVENLMRTTEMLARKYGMSEQQAQQMNERMMEQARGDGLELRLLDTQLTNTGDAHRVIHLAKALGKEPQVVEHLFHAYFTESRHVGRRESLVQIAVEAGLEQAEVEEMLASERFKDAVRADQSAAHELGVQGVPFYVFDNKFAVSGAQAKEMFQRALEQAYADRQPEAGQADSCNSDGCEI